MVLGKGAGFFSSTFTVVLVTFGKKVRKGGSGGDDANESEEGGKRNERVVRLV